MTRSRDQLASDRHKEALRQRHSREEEDLQRFYMHKKEREQELQTIKRIYTPMRFKNKKNILMLLFAFFMAGLVYFITRFIL